MKFLFRSFFIFFIFTNTISCKAQLVQSIGDAKKLEINEKQFINKPLKKLLEEIKPQIKKVLISPGGGETNSFFVFYFLDFDEIENLKAQNKTPVSIRVYTKENIDWNFGDKPKNEWWRWTENDEKKYGNLTVEAIRVSGKN